MKSDTNLADSTPIPSISPSSNYLITNGLGNTKRSKRIATWMLFIVIIVVCSIYIDVTPYQLFVGLPEMGVLLKEMFPPDWSYLPTIWAPMLQTIKIAVAGTILGAIPAIPAALFSANNITPNKWLSLPIRTLLNLVRTVPDLLFAAIFVAVFGIGPFAGMLALLFFSFGIIAKLTYESLEAIDPGPLEAMTAVGANRIQIIVFGVIPQALPAFISYLLYTFEINIRAATVLGFVGAGGIGLLLNQSLGLFRYDRAATIIILTLAVVLIIDYTSTSIRRKLL
ncbi:phosphonate ABC transporter, permease protein PhnE [Paenibacillus glacialis]|uniref:Phosphonate ABC transporter, permease protein PhnE n=1 Tax=Paenibacillus glacialis TaxID=494026 RepID=A0A168LSE2_9BACL|nr:phosphonate ABC transporter, permease protein PhnE [Paenibacillus glacialis]OAB43775.1 phosphonate ABC transporter, permease protein PhnE [Paenibacillus glacialis]